MRGQMSGFAATLVVVVVLGGFGLLLYHNARSTAPLRVIIPTQSTPTSAGNSWQEVFRSGFGDNTTPLPTIAIPTQRYNAPTLPPNLGPTTTPVPAAELGNGVLFTMAPVSTGVTATPPPSLTPRTTDAAQVMEPGGVVGPTDEWRPPPLTPPLNRDPLGRDHYWFTRPIDSSGVNYGLPTYMYGSDGPDTVNPSRVHTGLDMSNEIGSTVRATGAGTVIFASTDENPYFQNTSSYGVVVVIEHDFGWQGQPLWTLYAHLQRPLVQTGDHVEAGNPIALSGNSGHSSGPHLHYEIRMGENRYGSSYNPVLWVVPYVGYGTIAGRVVTERGNLIDDQPVTLWSLSTGSVETVTTTYILMDNENDVNPDPNWDENFAFGDVPVGRYNVITTYEGVRLSRTVNVYEGMTTFVELRPLEAATPQPVVTP